MQTAEKNVIVNDMQGDTAGSGTQNAQMPAAAQGSTSECTPGSDFEAAKSMITLDKVYDSLQEMIFTKDLNGRITSSNELYASHVKLTKSEIIGKTAAEISTISPANAVNIARIDAQVAQTRKPVKYREWSTYPDGTGMYTETVKTPIIVDDEVKGILVTIRDLTEFKRAMDETEVQKSTLETISKISELMLEPDINEFDDSIYKAMKLIAQRLGVNRIDIWKRQYDNSGTPYVLEYGWQEDKASIKGDLRREFIVPDRSTVERMEKAFAEGQHYNSKLCDMSLAAQELIRANGIDEPRSVLIMYITFDNSYWGYISCFDMERERVFSDSDVMLLSSSRQIIASAITRMQITKDLMYQTERLRYEVKLKGDFLARMSHEIRTPLNAVLGMTELALRERMSNAANEHIMTVKQTGLNMLSIINDILDFSKIKSGNIELTIASYGLSSLIYDIVSIIRMKLAHSRIRFIVDIDGSLPSELIGDEGKIRQILINLLSNSVKYTQRGFIRLAVGCENRQDAKLNLVLKVSDSGIGIKEEDQSKLFRDYIQVDREKNTGVEGVGLGLSITKGLVAAMDGSIYLNSVYGEGTEFTVVLGQEISDSERLAYIKDPWMKNTLVYERRGLYADTLIKSLESLSIRYEVVDNPDDVIRKMKLGLYSFLIGSVELLSEIRYDLDELGNGFQIIGIVEFGDESDSVWRTLSTPIHVISLANAYNNITEHHAYNEDDGTAKFSAPEAKVLIVDDIVTNLKVAAGLLSVFEVETDVCNSGQEALELVREKRYDLIFMDQRMPGMDGAETAAKIRAMAEPSEKGNAGDEYYKKVPIVVLTANVMSNIKDVYMEAGFNDFIAKPIDTGILSDIMRKWIPKSKQRRYYSHGKKNEETTLNMDSGISLTIPGVDADKGLRTAGGRMDLYLEILDTFRDEADGRLSQLHECIEAGDIRMYTSGVHALRGVLANIGADEMAELAAKLEDAGERKNAEYIEKNNSRFASGVTHLLANIKAVLSETAKSISGSRNISSEEAGSFASRLEELKNALIDMDAGVMNRTLETLLKDAPTEQYLSTIRLISKHILMAEYDEAEGIINNLLTSLDSMNY